MVAMVSEGPTSKYVTIPQLVVSFTLCASTNEVPAIKIATKIKNNLFFIYNEFKGLIIHCKCVNK